MKYILLSAAVPPETVDGIHKSTALEPVLLPAYAGLPEPVASHPDMLVFAHRDTIVTDSGYYSQNRTVFDEISSDTGKSLIFSTEKLGSVYPSDTRLNAFSLNGTLFGRLSSLSSEVKSLFSDFVGIKQGYAKCSSAVLPDNSVITADRGIAEAVSKSGFDVLTIEPGEIALPGYDTGFIGGSSFLFGNTLFFFGDIAKHTAHAEIYTFAGRHKCNISSLGGYNITDFGGAVIL